MGDEGRALAIWREAQQRFADAPDALETVRRGVYAGCVGYFAAGGDMDTCIALRTAVVKDGTLHVQAGGGVVYDSDPEAEYQESRNKAMALLRAAEEALAYAAKYGR